MPSHLVTCSAFLVNSTILLRTAGSSSVGEHPQLSPLATLAISIPNSSALATIASHSACVASWVSTPELATQSSIASKPSSFAWAIASATGSVASSPLRTSSNWR